MKHGLLQAGLLVPHIYICIECKYVYMCIYYLYIYSIYNTSHVYILHILTGSPAVCGDPMYQLFRMVFEAPIISETNGIGSVQNHMGVPKMNGL